MALATDALAAAMERDAAERLRREEAAEAERRREAESAAAAPAPSPGKVDLTARLRKAGNIARLRARMGAPKGGGAESAAKGKRSASKEMSPAPAEAEPVSSTAEKSNDEVVALELEHSGLS